MKFFLTLHPMRKILSIIVSVASVIFVGCVDFTKTASHADAQNTLVVIHTNDTHSHIDPIAATGMGGVMRRMELIDSIRAVQPNVLLIDAGDIVQGTLYFHLYKGEVEQKVLNALGYDIQILGNHEFDNGMDALKTMLSQAQTTLLSSNYEFADSLLDAKFQSYVVKEYGKHRVGIFALNLNPEGMIAEGNYDGVTFLPWKSVVNQTVDKLRNQLHCDYVIAVNHIGYNAPENSPLFGDVQVAEQTQGIDLIVGAHSHTRLDSAVIVHNVIGNPVAIVQTGRNGEFLGETTINLKTKTVNEKLIPVIPSHGNIKNDQLEALIAPYRSGIDSLYNIELAFLKGSEPLSKGNGYALQNFAADFIWAKANELAPDIIGALANSGSLRTTWNPGKISQGDVIDMMPFHNKIVVLDIKGADLIEAQQIMRQRNDCAVAGIGGSESINPNKTYRIATVDYLANGGDYMTPLTRAKQVAQSKKLVFEDLINFLKQNPEINPNNTKRLK